MEGLDLTLSLKNQSTKINEQMGIQRVEKKGYSDALIN